ATRRFWGTVFSFCRCNVRTSHHRRPHGALRLLGSHIRPVLPAHRIPSPPNFCPPVSVNSTDCDHLRGSSYAGGPTYVRSRCWLISGFRRRQPGCRIAHRRFCRRLHDLGYRFGVTGSVNQICTSSVSLLAASSNGSTNPRFGLLTRSRQGQSRYLPRRPMRYGKVSLPGLIQSANDLGTDRIGVAVLAMLLTDALFKAILFMVVGAVDQTERTKQLKEVAGLDKAHPALMCVDAIAALSDGD